MLYLHIITNTPDGTGKVWRFVPVAKAERLIREEILVWLHLSYGGLLEAKHLSRKLGIPLFKKSQFFMIYAIFLASKLFKGTVL